MNYIKVSGTDVQIGGQVATEAMLADGWFEYHGNIPSYDPAKFEYLAYQKSKVVKKVDKEKLLEKQKADALAYLSKTDHKFLVGYVPSKDEDLDAIQEQRNKARSLLRGETE